jgi:biofilm PGA synthesis lipoprotein PgaB
MARSILMTFMLIFAGQLWAAELPPRITVLQYHHVSESTPASTSLSPERFREHLQWLVDNDFVVGSLPESLARLRAGESLPPKFAVITFDDGYRNIYENAFPVLRELELPFTIFINPAPHDAGRSAWLTWDQLREMSDAGATIANHTVSHAFLVREEEGESEAEWLERVQREIEGAENRIAKETGQNHKLLAYPYGESNPAIRSLVAELGYTAFGQQSGPIGRDSDFTNLPRFPLAGPYSAMNSFQTKMRSLPLSVRSVVLQTESGDELLRNEETRPVMILELSEPGNALLNCFASGQGAIPAESETPGLYRIVAPKPLSVGRSRYNCTLASPWGGRYYWFSQAWVRRGEGERWVHQ